LEQREAYRRAAYVGPPRMRSNAVGGGNCTFSLALEDATMMPLQLHVYAAQREERGRKGACVKILNVNKQRAFKFSLQLEKPR
jgi:hypothetical protein